MVSLQMKRSSSESGRTFATWTLDRTNLDSQRLSQLGRTVVLCTTILCSVKVALHNVLTVYLAVYVHPDLWVRPGVISSAIRGDKVARPHVAASALPKSAASEMCRGCSRFWRKGTPQTAKPVSPVNPGSGWPWTNLFSSTFNLVNIICLLILLFVFLLTKYSILSKDASFGNISLLLSISWVLERYCSILSDETERIMHF